MAAVRSSARPGRRPPQRAPASAAVWFGDALRLLPGDGARGVRVELLLARARALAATGQFARATAALHDSFRLVPPEAVALRCVSRRHAPVSSTCSAATSRRTPGSSARCDALADAGSAEAATLMIELAMDGFALMDYGRMRAWAERAGDRRAARRPAVGGGRRRGARLCLCGRWRHRRGARPAARGGRPGRGPVDDPNSPFASTRPSTSPAPSSTWTSMPRRGARRPRDSGGPATGQSELVPLAYSILGQVKLLRGQLAEAGELLDNAVEGARLSGNVQALAGNLLNRSLTAVAAGDSTWRSHRAGERRADRMGWTRAWLPRPGWRSATALLETGDPGRPSTSSSCPRAATSSRSSPACGEPGRWSC